LLQTQMDNLKYNDLMMPTIDSVHHTQGPDATSNQNKKISVSALGISGYGKQQDRSTGLGGFHIQIPPLEQGKAST